MSQGLEQIERRDGRGVVVRGNDIDTDQIIPARFLVSTTFEGLGENAFADVRYTTDGTPKAHPFNEDRYQGAKILLVNKNFGCGSSREHAPQALRRWGIQAIVGESFAEIFFGNCVALGMPAVTMPEDELMPLMDSVELDPSQELVLDLTAMTISSRLGTKSITLPSGARQQLMDGTWDGTRTLLVAQDEIQALADRLPYVSGY